MINYLRLFEFPRFKHLYQVENKSLVVFILEVVVRVPLEFLKRLVLPRVKNLVGHGRLLINHGYEPLGITKPKEFSEVVKEIVVDKVPEDVDLNFIGQLDHNIKVGLLCDTQVSVVLPFVVEKVSHFVFKLWVNPLARVVLPQHDKEVLESVLLLVVLVEISQDIHHPSKAFSDVREQNNSKEQADGNCDSFLTCDWDNVTQADS